MTYRLLEPEEHAGRHVMVVGGDNLRRIDEALASGRVRGYLATELLAIEPDHVRIRHRVGGRRRS